LLATAASLEALLNNSLPSGQTDKQIVSEYQQQQQQQRTTHNKNKNELQLICMLFECA